MQVLDDEDNNFRRLYNDILDQSIDINLIPDEDISNAITSIIESFTYERGGSYRHVDYNRYENACGYIFRYVPHGAGLARCRILEALRNCPELESVVLKSHLSVASLGGGPANDAIGFCSALSQSGKFPKKMDIVIVDSVENWSGFVDMAYNQLIQGGYGHASNFFLQEVATLAFERCVLPIQMPSLRNYDMVLICKLFSILSLRNKRNLVERLYSAMKDDALILWIDSPFHEDLWRGRFRILYISAEDNHYEYRPTDPPLRRYGYDDCVTSQARIAILKKNT